MFRPFDATPLSEVTADDLNGLIKRSIEEGLFVEYKSQWTPFKVARGVASFANTYGGTLIVGIDAPARVPSKLTPIKDDGGLEDRVIQTIRSNNDPVPAFTPQVVRVGKSKACAIVEVREGTHPPYLLIGTGQVFVRPDRCPNLSRRTIASPSTASSRKVVEAWTGGRPDSTSSPTS